MPAPASHPFDDPSLAWPRLEPWLAGVVEAVALAPVSARSMRLLAGVFPWEGVALTGSAIERLIERPDIPRPWIERLVALEVPMLTIMLLRRLPPAARLRLGLAATTQGQISQVVSSLATERSHLHRLAPAMAADILDLLVRSRERALAAHLVATLPLATWPPALTARLLGSPDRALRLAAVSALSRRRPRPHPRLHCP